MKKRKKLGLFEVVNPKDIVSVSTVLSDNIQLDQLKKSMESNAAFAENKND